MRRGMLVLFVLMLMGALLFASPALADFATVTLAQDGDAMYGVEDAGGAENGEDNFTVAYIIGAVIVVAVLSGADVIKTKSLVAGYETFITRITSDVELTDALESGYMRLPGEARQMVDLPMDLVALLSKLTPTARDDALADFVKRIRDGLPNQ